MRHLVILMLFAGAAMMSSCEKEVITPFVAIEGNFVNITDPAAGFWEIPLPDGSVFMSPKKYVVDGESTVFGPVDETQSVLEMKSIVFAPEFAGFKGDVKVTLVDADGDKLYAVGEVLSFPDFSNNAYFHFDGGTGKWDGAEGWMNSTGDFNLETGVNTLEMVGEVTDPK